MINGSVEFKDHFNSTFIKSLPLFCITHIAEVLIAPHSQLLPPHKNETNKSKRPTFTQSLPLTKVYRNSRVQIAKC